MRRDAKRLCNKVGAQRAAVETLACFSQSLRYGSSQALLAEGAPDIEEQSPSNGHRLQDKDQPSPSQGNTRVQSFRGVQGNVESMSSQALGSVQQGSLQSPEGQVNGQQGVHGYRYFAKGMDMALERLKGMASAPPPRFYSALIQKGKESKQSFLMHDVFQEMQLNGQTAEPGAFMKACVGCASEYGGARPWESRLFYDAMQRSGAQINESGFEDLLKSASGPGGEYLLEQVVRSMSASNANSPIVKPGSHALLKFYERMGMTAAATAELNGRIEASSPLSTEAFKDLM